MPPRVRFLPPLCSLNRPAQCALLARRSPILYFHTSRRLQDDNNFPNHYEALELQPNASAAEIKRQFYSLSKRHHPDLARSHPSPSSSDEPQPSPTRFHQINEAYHVLGSAEARQRYDRDYNRHFGIHQRHPPAHPQGSFSSAYAGSRPPSGLSRRKTQFKGPPPSFYQQGMYGNGGSAHTRQANADGEAAKAQATGKSASSGGFGPGGTSGAFDEGVPHFDRDAHKRTLDGVASTTSRSRASRQRQMTAEDFFAAQGGDMLVNFIMMSGLLAFVIAVPLYFLKDQHQLKKETKK